MSFMSKFTSIFGSSQSTKGPQSPNDPRLDEVLQQILRPGAKFNLKNASQTLTIFILEKDENLDLVFNLIKSPSYNTKLLQPLSLVQLLGAIHKSFQNLDLQYDLAMKLKETKLEWVQKVNKKIDPDIQRRVETEVQEDDDQFKKQYLATEGDNAREQFDIDQFTQNYHTYLQRLAANVDLYRSVSNNLYPYVSAKDYVEPKLMFLWHYKIQNILNTALPLLGQYEQSIQEIQKLIWTDLYMFQRFLCIELQKVVDNYATLPNSDTLSLYEIFTDTIKHSKLMDQFVAQSKGNYVLQSAPQVGIPQSTLQDFLGFASRLKVLNQFTFKKSIKVPNKMNPCMGIPTHNPNLRHLRSTSGHVVNNNPQQNPKSMEQIEDQMEDIEEHKGGMEQSEEDVKLIRQ